MSKYTVEYKFKNKSEIISLEFDDAIKAFKFQGDLIRKKKNKLDFAEVKTL